MKAATLLFIIDFVLLALIGCTSTDPVFLRHPKTGQTVQCGSYKYRGVGAPPMAVVVRESKCIDDYKQQGYERVPK